MNAIILSVGDELVLGQTVDTNSAWISQQLAAVGIPVAAHMTVGDDQNAIEQAIRESAERVPVLIISGGIGPTEDDLTRQALAKVMGVELELNEIWLTKLQEFFTKLGRVMPETNKIQAMIPRGAQMIDNSAGTAAGIRAELGASGKGQGAIAESPHPSPHAAGPCTVFVMPGVPKEMKIMFARDVLPHLSSDSGGAVILSKTLHTFGAGESTVAEKLGPLMRRDRNPSVGTTVANGFVSLRINSRFPSKGQALIELLSTVYECEKVLGPLIWGGDEQTFQESMIRMLQAHSEQLGRTLTATTAESCTGGLLAKMLTDLSGSSGYFRQGWVTYSNEAKRERLGVSENLINLYGAVSEEVVEAMATHARRLAKADFALAISGVAGPTGGTPAKPVGTVCIGFAYPTEDPRAFAKSNVFKRTFTFTGDREMIRDRSAKMALTILRFHLLGKPLPF